MPLSYPDDPEPSRRRRRIGRRGAEAGNEEFDEFWQRQAVPSTRGTEADVPPGASDVGPGRRAGPAPGRGPGRASGRRTGPVPGPAPGPGPTPRAGRSAGPGPATAAYPAYPAEAQRPPGGGGYGGDAYADDGYDEDYYEDEYDDYEGIDEDRSRRRGCRAVLLTFAVLLIAAGVAAWFAWSWVQRQIDPSGDPGEAVLVEIPEGSSTSDVGHELADAGVISNATVWDWYIRFRTPGEFEAGRYRMQLNSSFTEAIDALEEGALPPDAILVTVPEGLTLTETLARLADPEDGVEGFTPQTLQQAVADPASRSSFLPADQRSLEGTLFPETYQVEVGTDTPATVIQRMVGQLDDTLTELEVESRAQVLGLSPYQLLIVASLIEEEAGTDADRPRIARVIYNRLAEPMPLQIDATSCYVKNEPGGCTLTDADLASDSPYNTRNRQGLPPTPIASPGRASIEAALNPADGPWWLYVLDAEANDGSHFFTDDIDEFNAARERCREAGLGCG
jgi:UPF0755 protein